MCSSASVSVFTCIGKLLMNISIRFTLFLKHTRLGNLHLLPELLHIATKTHHFSDRVLFKDEAQKNILNIPLKIKMHGKLF